MSLDQPTRHLRRGPSRGVAAAAALVLAVAGLTVASPAHAEPLPINDGFDGDPASRWTVSTVPGITNVFLGNDARYARPGSGTGVALLGAYPGAPATATISRTIFPDTAGPRNVRVRVYVRRFINEGEKDPSVQVMMRVRQGTRNGQIISNMGRAVVTTANWELHTFHPARPTGAFTVEIAAYLGTAIIDDVQIGVG
ncbi:MAG TPA: hypothetical protein VES42_13975 [Pilimelia sp.]|nr:hypothetical protein [Pilimelia sp.]